MSPEEIKQRVEEARRKLDEVLENSKRDIENMLKGKVLIFSDKSYITYMFPDKVTGDLGEEEDSDFHLKGYLIQLNFEPIPKFQISYGSVDIEDNLNPKPVIKDLSNEILEELKTLLEKRILKKPFQSPDEISYWQGENLYNKKDLFFIKPPFLAHHFIVTGKKDVPENKIKIQNVWSLIEETISPENRLNA